MNEELQEKANEVLLKLLEGIEQSGEFIVDQAPDVVQQLLRWHMVEALGMASLAVLCAVGVLWLSRVTWKFFGSDVSAQLADGSAMLYVILFMLLIPCCGIALSRLSTAAQIYVAPKLYLIEYAADLAR